jgi:hypothetical protein
MSVARWTHTAPEFSTIVDPLPLISTAASDLEWLLVLVYVSTTVVLLFWPRLAPREPRMNEARSNHG